MSTFVEIHQFFRFLRWISWLRRQLGCCQPFVVEATSWFPEETNPLQTKFCVIRVGRLVSCSDSNFHRPVFGGIGRDPLDFLSEVDLLFFRVGDGSLLRFIRFCFLRWISSLNAVVGCCQRFVIEAASVLTVVSFGTCLWYRRWLNRSITSGFCPHCLYEAKGSDSLQIAGSSPDFLLGGHRLQRYSH